MPINRSAKKLTALVLAGGVVAVGTGAQTLAVGSGADPASASAETAGNPNAVPPILRSATPSELTEIRIADAWDGQKLYYDPPATARYSSAVMSVFGNR